MSTAVALVEVIKLLISLSIATYDMAKAHPSARPTELIILLYRSLCSSDSWKLIIPAGLYTLQNYLIYVALEHMAAVTFQVTYQLKIITTVVFSILILGKSIRPRQWLSLALLTIGIAIVQTSESRSVTFSSLAELRDRTLLVFQDQPTAVASHPASAQTSLSAPSLSLSLVHTPKGLPGVIAASLISGLTCVYFEKLVKDSLSSVSLWTRNVQLSFFSLFPAAAICVIGNDCAIISHDGIFAGYTPVVWATVGLQAVGGLLVAMCITYANNVTKNFAASLSIVVNCIAGSVLFMDPMTVNVS